MNKETRIKNIAEIIKRDKEHGRQDIPWKDKLEPMSVYLIPLEYLVYNKYNGRILSRTKSLEMQGYEIDAASKEGKVLIEKLLMDSNPSRNRQTLESINKIGQEKVGIITRDGIIIDGNRRAMLLNKSGKYDYFKTVVLDVTLEENPLEIEKLETTYQMGEDEKLGYKAIEKYLKSKLLHKRNISVDKIADWMGEDNSKIKEYLDVMNVMDEYLEYLGCKGIYTQLDEREDQFISLTRWLDTFYGESSSKGFDGYTDSDVDDLKIISFDYIRAIYEGKEFRNIGYGLRDNHFFGDRKIWESFRDFHFKKVDLIKDKESKIDFKSDNLEAYLKDRDSRYYQNTKNNEGESFLEENIRIHKQQLQNKKSANEPSKLVSTASDALNAINQKNSSFSSSDVSNGLERISEKVINMIAVNSPDKIIFQVVKMLKSIPLGKDSTLKKHMLVKIKEIEKIVDLIKKDIE
ncbi:MAG: hypothetical protein KBC42_00545 [Candidatus Pacebacteria bacterium]|nr:hypothetical protein [Candidatus Paceibacterota bacterium]MBP9780396.1 hypothetical protein [Candidatus Paceibacterota bacterium]